MAASESREGFRFFFWGLLQQADWRIPGAFLREDFGEVFWRWWTPFALAIEVLVAGVVRLAVFPYVFEVLVAGFVRGIATGRDPWPGPTPSFPLPIEIGGISFWIWPAFALVMMVRAWPHADIVEKRIAAEREQPRYFRGFPRLMPTTAPHPDVDPRGWDRAYTHAQTVLEPRVGLAATGVCVLIDPYFASYIFACVAAMRGDSQDSARRRREARLDMQEAITGQVHQARLWDRIRRNRGLPGQPDKTAYPIGSRAERLSRKRRENAPWWRRIWPPRRRE